jgi:hypothetical protein
VYDEEEGINDDHGSQAVFSGGRAEGTDGKQAGLFTAATEIKPASIQISEPAVSGGLLPWGRSGAVGRACDTGDRREPGGVYCKAVPVFHYSLLITN